MAKTNINCEWCGKGFLKENKELNRRIKLGKLLYCSASCAGKVLIKNIPMGLGNVFVSGSISHERAVSAAAITNRRYSQEEKPFAEYLRRAKHRRWDCNLTIPILMELWLKQEGRCAFSGIPLQHPSATNNRNCMGSLDRINSNVGYLTGNVQFVSCALNLAKGASKDSAITDLIRLIVENFDHTNASGKNNLHASIDFAK